MWVTVAILASARLILGPFMLLHLTGSSAETQFVSVLLRYFKTGDNTGNDRIKPENVVWMVPYRHLLEPKELGVLIGCGAEQRCVVDSWVEVKQTWVNSIEAAHPASPHSETVRLILPGQNCSLWNYFRNFFIEHFKIYLDIYKFQILFERQREEQTQRLFSHWFPLQMSTREGWTRLKLGTWNSN